MPVQFESVASNSVSGLTSLPIAKPVGLAVGELMVGIVAHHFFGQPTNLPSGWTRVQDFIHPQGADKTTLAFKIADAADVAASDFTFTRGGTGAEVVFVGAILRISGVDTFGPINIHLFATDSTFATSVSTPSVVTTVNGVLLLRIAQGFSSLVGVGIISAVIGSAAYTERVDIRNRGSKEFGLAVYTIDVPQPLAGATGTETITISGQGNNPGVTGLTIAITPTPPPPGGGPVGGIKGPLRLLGRRWRVLGTGA